MADKAADTICPEVPGQGPSRPGSILIVDDTPANLYLLEDIVAAAGYEVRTLPTSVLVMRSLAHALPDLILLDIKMPGWDGFDLCQQLKADTRTRDIPIVFISALAEPQDKARAFALGGVDYIAKPFVAEEVLARVATHLQRGANERQLRRLAARQQAILAGSGEGILGLDSHCRLTFMNHKAQSLLGYREAELRHTDVHALIHHTDVNGQPLPLTACPIILAARQDSSRSIARDRFFCADGGMLDVAYTVTRILPRAAQDDHEAIVIFRKIAGEH